MVCKQGYYKGVPERVTAYSDNPKNSVTFHLSLCYNV